MKITIIIISILFHVLNGYCQTQQVLNDYAMSKYQLTDNELNQLYQKVMHEYKSDTIFIKSMKEAQRQWLKFRDSQLRMKYPPYPDNEESSLPMCRYYYLTGLTSNRIIELRQWLDGVTEGDVCSGSIKQSH